MNHHHQTDHTRGTGLQRLRVHCEFTGPIHIPVMAARTRNEFPPGALAWRSMARIAARINPVQRVAMLLGTPHLVGAAYRPRTHTNRQETPGL